MSEEGEGKGLIQERVKRHDKLKLHHPGDMLTEQDQKWVMGRTETEAGHLGSMHSATVE